MTRSGGRALVAIAIAVAALGGTSVDAARRRGEREKDARVIVDAVRALPGADLAIAGGARHLRFVSLEEPAAAFADLPAMLDAEPAGGAIAPPRDAWANETRDGSERTMLRGE